MLGYANYYDGNFGYLKMFAVSVRNQCEAICAYPWCSNRYNLHLAHISSGSFGYLTAELFYQYHTIKAICTLFRFWKINKRFS